MSKNKEKVQVTECQKDSSRLCRFRIDKVVNHREQGGETEYLVRWKGYDESHNEWKKEQDITSAALDEYKQRL